MCYWKPQSCSICFTYRSHSQTRALKTRPFRNCFHVRRTPYMVQLQLQLLLRHKLLLRLQLRYKLQLRLPLRFRFPITY